MKDHGLTSDVPAATDRDWIASFQQAQMKYVHVLTTNREPGPTDQVDGRLDEATPADDHEASPDRPDASQQEHAEHQWHQQQEQQVWVHPTGEPAGHDDSTKKERPSEDQCQDSRWKYPSTTSPVHDRAWNSRSRNLLLQQFLNMVEPDRACSDGDLLHRSSEGSAECTMEAMATDNGRTRLDGNDILITAFYCFVKLDDHERMQPPLRQHCLDNDVRGIILLAAEGINATIAGPRDGVMAVIDRLRCDPRLSRLEWKESIAQGQPFRKLRVRLKKEIITMGVPTIDVAEHSGRYVEPEQWNELIQQEDVLVIDTRNTYETGIGTFKGAIDPGIESFSELPDWLDRNLDPGRHRKVAMFCTGGIRCEKSTAYLRQAGFDEVYHLKGGILKYLEHAARESSLWEGECFVFDERVSVGHGLVPGNLDLCRGCRAPIDDMDKSRPEYIEGVSCPSCHDQTSPEQKQRFAQRQMQVRLASGRGEHHMGHQPMSDSVS